MNFNFVREWYLPWRSYVAEFLASFAFVFICLSVVLVDFLYGEVSSLNIGIVVGFSYAALVYSTVHLSGGFLNPAVTIALWLAGKLASAKTFFLIVAQILASFAAAYTVLLVFGGESLNFAIGAPGPGLGVTSQMALILEAILTCVLIFGVFATTVDKNGPVSFGPLVVGLLLAGITITAFDVSGGSVNPIRAIGAQILSKNWQNMAVYVIGPLVGSLMGILYDFVFLRKRG